MRPRTPAAQQYEGKSRYFADYDDGRDRYLVAVDCRLGETTFPALFDTGSQWCVLPPRTAQALGYDLAAPQQTVPLSTRFGTFHGRLERIALSFPVEEGVTVEVDATWFISPDWPGPAVIGWKGCLERIRFALDPSDDNFYFGDL
jgi:Aspartyl protease